MNKKVLVLTLALMVAFAGSAMAAVKIGGDFTATMETDSFKVFKDKYELEPTLQFKISASNSNVTKSSEVVETTVVDEETGEEIVVLETKESSHTNWDFSARLNSHTKAGNEELFFLERYKLELNDQYFTAWVWGGKQNLTDKKTYFDMIKAAKEPGDYMRARVLVPVMDLADVTVDFAAKDNARFFVEGEVEGFNVGLAYARTNWSDEDNIKNVLVGQVGTEVPAGDFAIDTKAAVGVTLGDDLGLAFGLSGKTNLTEELEVEASVTTANEKWAGNGPKAKDTVLKAGATYTESAYQVAGSVKHTLTKDVTEGKNELELSAAYRMSDKLIYDDLFNEKTADGKLWYTNDAPAFGVFSKFENLKFGHIEAKVAAPVVDNMVWAMASGKYEGDSKFGAKAQAYATVTDKLTLKPSVEYKSTGTVTDVQLVADYAIGFSTTKLTFTGQRIFTEEGHTDDDGKLVAKSLLKASITIPF